MQSIQSLPAAPRLHLPVPQVIQHKFNFNHVFKILHDPRHRHYPWACAEVPLLTDKQIIHPSDLNRSDCNPPSIAVYLFVKSIYHIIGLSV